MVQVYLDENSKKIWEKLFRDKEGNFSEWIRIKLEEEMQKELDPELCSKKLADLFKQREMLDGEISHWQGQYEKGKGIRESKKIIDNDFEQEKPDKENIIRTLKIIIEARFKIKDKEKLSILAEEFYTFREQNQDLDKNESIDRFAVEKGLIIPIKKEIAI